MAKTSKKTLARKRRQYKVRKKVFGTAERPRVLYFGLPSIFMLNSSMMITTSTT